MKLRLVLLAIITVVCGTATAVAAQPFRLFEISVVRFIKDTSGETILDRGTLAATGEFKHNIYNQLTPGYTVQPEAMNVNLLPFAFWPAYEELGRDTLANFKLNSVLINDAPYWIVTVADQPKLDVGTLANLSTRGSIVPGGDPMIGGFVVEGHPRWVLIRGVGPALGALGVASPLANPTIKIFHQGDAVPIAVNDDWAQQAKPDDVAVAATTVGAFPLSRTSKDAALLIELSPGIYTAHVGSADATGGTALLEVYVLP